MKYALSHPYSLVLLAMSGLTAPMLAIALFGWVNLNYLGWTPRILPSDLGWVCVILAVFMVGAAVAAMVVGAALSPVLPLEESTK